MLDGYDQAAMDLALDAGSEPAERICTRCGEPEADHIDRWVPDYACDDFVTGPLPLPMTQDEHVYASDE
jgi:hypothetical protein